MQLLSLHECKITGCCTSRDELNLSGNHNRRITAQAHLHLVYISSLQVKELEDQLAQSQQPEQAASSEDTIAQLNARASVAEQVQAKAQSSINTLQAELSSLREQLAEAQAEAASRAESAPQAIQPPEQPEETAGGVGAGAHLQGDVGEAEQLREEVAGLRIEARALVGQLREAQGREASLLQQQEQAEALRVGLEGERETALQEARSSREALRAAEDKLMALQVSKQLLVSCSHNDLYCDLHFLHRTDGRRPPSSLVWSTNHLYLHRSWWRYKFLLVDSSPSMCCQRSLFRAVRRMNYQWSSLKLTSTALNVMLLPCCDSMTRLIECMLPHLALCLPCV